VFDNPRTWISDSLLHRFCDQNGGGRVSHKKVIRTAWMPSTCQTVYSTINQNSIDTVYSALVTHTPYYFPRTARSDGPNEAPHHPNMWGLMSSRVQTRMHRMGI